MAGHREGVFYWRTTQSQAQQQRTGPLSSVCLCEVVEAKG